MSLELGFVSVLVIPFIKDVIDMKKDMKKDVENGTNLMICLSSCSIPLMRLQTQMLFLIFLSSSCFHDKGI